MSIAPMPMPEEHAKDIIAKEATAFLFETRQIILDRMKSYGCLADPRLTALVAWINDNLQIQTDSEIKIHCGRCGAIHMFSVAVLSTRPATGLYCPFCEQKLPNQL